MKIYRTIRRVDEFDIDEKDFLDFLKKENLEDEDIQKSNNINELIKEFGDIDEFSGELDIYLNQQKRKNYYCIEHYYDNYNEAYDEAEWGLH